MNLNKKLNMGGLQGVYPLLIFVKQNMIYSKILMMKRLDSNGMISHSIFIVAIFFFFQ